MANILEKLFGTKHDRDAKKHQPIIDEINTAYAVIIWVVMLLCLLLLGVWGLTRTDIKLKQLAGEAEQLLGRHHEQQHRESANPG